MHLLLLALLACAAACSPGPSSPDSSPATEPLKADTLEPDHPFLVAKERDFPALRVKALQSPWRELALSAIDYARNEVFDPTASDFDAKTRMTDLCGALALAQVLDPRPTRVTKLRDTLLHWQTFFLPATPQGSGTLLRWRQSAMIQSIIALDVMHDALDPGDLALLEDMLDGMIRQWWENLDQDGTPSTPGVVATWALYRGQRGLAGEASALFLERLSVNLTPSGLYDSGTGYAWVRQGSDRLSKYALLDILEATGMNEGLYSDPRLRTLHEWMYRGAFTPRRTNLTFGDSDPSRPIEGLLGYVQPYRANKFSAQAGRNAAWVVRDVFPRPLLSNFVLLDDTALAPEAPSSAVWEDSASFWESGAGVDSLMGALWNARSNGGHSHRDTNAVHLYAYGENILRNSGYCGSGIGIDATFDWDWVFEATASSNTVTIDDLEHDEKFGGGIVEGFTAPGFDYAAGVSGPALETGTHTRSLVMVHNQPGRSGYFVLFDELEADVPGASMVVNLHPDASLATTLGPTLEYQWPIQRFGLEEVRVNLFLGTRPALAELRDGGLCAFDGNEYVGKYLRSTYPTDAAGLVNAVTLVVPHDADHPKPALSRIGNGSLYSGALVVHSAGNFDFVIESKGVGPVPFGAALFQGKGIHCQVETATVGQYFVRKGILFDDGLAQRTGFDSDAEISVLARDRAAFVASAGATVVFHEPSLTGNVFATPAGTVLGAGVGFVEIALTPGVHAFDLHSGASLRLP